MPGTVLDTDDKVDKNKNPCLHGARSPVAEIDSKQGSRYLTSGDKGWKGNLSRLGVEGFGGSISGRGIRDIWSGT